MRRLARMVGSVLGLLAGTTLALVGILLILYNGDVRAGAEGDVEVSFWGGVTIDADLVGIALIVFATVLVMLSVRVLRSRAQ